MATRKLGIVYQQTKLTIGKAFSISKVWHPKIDSWSPIYTDMLQPFNFHKFTVPRLPIDMGKIDSDSIVALKKCPNVLRVPIKYGNSTEVRLPSELLPIEEEIKRILHYDYFVTGANWKKFHCHLTIHNAIVNPGDTQRFPGFHGDGLQGGKFKKKLLCEHSYVLSDPQPTIISMQPFFVAHLNEDKENIFKAFDQQVRSDSLLGLRPQHLYLIDPYIVHESPKITGKDPILRTFFRLTTTPTELLMPKNTINPMFSGQAYSKRIEVREFVSAPNQEIPYSAYGLSIPPLV